MNPCPVQQYPQLFYMKSVISSLKEKFVPYHRSDGENNSNFLDKLPNAEAVCGHMKRAH